MQRNYEAIFIVSAKLSENEVKDLSEQYKNIIMVDDKVKIIETSIENRQLAYPIKKQTKGIFIKYKFSATPDVISKIKDAIKHREEILRSTIIKQE
ncbi:MAG: 30S ribosomal protein S6 [candidate division WOR-3 bacterium]